MVGKIGKIMIDVIKQTPIEYSKQSRDYQVLARLYTALYNINKMYIDNMNIWNDDIDNKLSTLRARTLNFIPKHNWDLNELDAAMSCFKYIMRRKGTIQALKYCLTILLRIKKLTGELSTDLGTIEVNYDDYTINVLIPSELVSVGVVEDLFDYLLPAGITYRLTEYRYQDLGNDVTNIYYQPDTYRIWYRDNEMIKDWQLQISDTESYNTQQERDLQDKTQMAGKIIYRNAVPAKTVNDEASEEVGAEITG